MLNTIMPKTWIIETMFFYGEASGADVEFFLWRNSNNLDSLKLNRSCSWSVDLLFRFEFERLAYKIKLVCWIVFHFINIVT